MRALLKAGADPEARGGGGGGGGGPSASGFKGEALLADAHEYCKFAVTALKKERNAAQGRHFAALALDMLQGESAPKLADAHRFAFKKGVGALPEDHVSVGHALEAVDALSGGGKAGRQVDKAIAALQAVFASLR